MRENNKTVEEILAIKAVLEKYNVSYEEYISYCKLLTLNDIADSLEEIKKD